MIRQVLQLGNEMLKRKSKPVEGFQSKSLESLIGDLSDTLHDAQERFGYGRGIAAPQLGKLKRVIFIDTSGFKSPLINPRIVQFSDRRFEVWDSCFSFNLAFFVLVDRYYSIRVEYFDQEGKKHAIDAEDKLSELLQHEIDHLDGVLATDRMKGNQKIMMRSEWEKTFKPSA
ncbi:MAG: peptide deformylase [Candidatus Bathyarchaeota archaeon]|jgi:peptide deformylase